MIYFHDDKHAQCPSDTTEHAQSHSLWDFPPSYIATSMASPILKRCHRLCHLNYFSCCSVSPSPSVESWQHATVRYPGCVNVVVMSLIVHLRDLLAVWFGVITQNNKVSRQTVPLFVQPLNVINKEQLYSQWFLCLVFY